jgi:hypothetical protein
MFCGSVLKSVRVFLIACSSRVCVWTLGARRQTTIIRTIFFFSCHNKTISWKPFLLLPMGYGSSSTGTMFGSSRRNTSLHLLLLSTAFVWELSFLSTTTTASAFLVAAPTLTIPTTGSHSPAPKPTLTPGDRPGGRSRPQQRQPPQPLLSRTRPCSASSSSSSSPESSGLGGVDSGGDFFFPRGPSQQRPPSKTYGEAARSPLENLIDLGAAMENFFTSREEWLPLFRLVAKLPQGSDDDYADDGDDDWPSDLAMTYLGTQTKMNLEESLFDFDETSEPWRRLPAIPDKEEDRQVLAGFLDSMQESLIAIPVREDQEEDENDLQFLEEGRRLLAINRFHVIHENHGGSVESYDALFSTCWSEIMELRRTDQEHTGSIILVPEYDLTDLRRFADMNLIRPLEWLGLGADFEVASMRRGSPAIRLLYKLKDMPTDSYTEPPDEEE